MINVGVVGGGVAALGFLWQALQELERGTSKLRSISVFDSAKTLGAGLAYNKDYVDPEHSLITPSYIVAIPEDNSDFLAFLKEKKVEMYDEFRQIFDLRFRKKFLSRFGMEYSGKNSPPDLEQKDALCAHYEKLWNSFSKRYLEVDSPYLSRLALGNYTIHLFNHIVEKIRDYGMSVNLYPGAIVRSLKKDQAQEGIILSVGDTDYGFDHVVVAIGRMFKDSAELRGMERYCEKLFPISDFRERLDNFISKEIVRRIAGECDDRIIKIAIQGNSLSAIDAVKTIFSDGFFEADASGVFRYNPDGGKNCRIEVDLVSRSHLVTAVNGRSKWLSQPPFALPANLVVSEKKIIELANLQKGKIHLWQFMLMFLCSMSDAYRSEGEPEKAIAFREFLKGILEIIPHSKGNEILQSDQLNQLLDNLSFNPLHKLSALQNLLGLALEERTDYGAIIQKIEQFFDQQSPLDSLKTSLRFAKEGEVKSGHLISKDIIIQFTSLNITKYLSSEDSAVYKSDFVSRVVNAFSNRMTIESAEELLALNYAGLLNFKVVGYAEKMLCESDGKIFIQNSRGERMDYDYVINATGHENNMLKASELYRAMLENGIIKADAQGNAQSFYPDVVLIDSKGQLINQAFRFGISAAQQLSKVDKVKPDNSFRNESAAQIRTAQTMSSLTA